MDISFVTTWRARWDKWQKYITPSAIIWSIIVLTALVQSINLFGFPGYREDEGTYMSQAWSVIKLNRLAPYTYWYDHAPLGWIFIAGWNVLFGHSSWYGILVNNGRVLMVLVQVICAILVYLIAHRLTKHTGLALLATTLFIFSPINIVFHRQVLLDNIMIMWVLLSLYLLTKPLTLVRGIASALCFGVAVLSKETAAILFPWLALLAGRLAHHLNRRLVIATWLTVAALMISFYPLFALLKGELFPTGTWLGGDNPHVSLWDAINFQWSRNQKQVDTETFWYAWSQTWGQYGPWLIVLGAITTLYHLSRHRDPWLFTFGGIAWTIILFLLRGQVLDWYIIPLLPIFALSIALFFGHWPHAPPLFKKLHPVAQPIGMAVLGLMTAYNLAQNSYIFTYNQTKNQQEAVKWVKQNILGKGIVITDNYAFMDLNPNLGSDIRTAQAHYYWKVDTDPQIKNDVLKNDWNSIDYLLVTPAIVRTMNADDLTFVKEAYKNSHIIQWFRHNNTPPLAYPAEIREVNNSRGVIQTGWRTYRDTYITTEGRVIDRPDINGTTSEAQSYALLRAVWANDQPTFDKVWHWTKTNMQHTNNSLFGWLYTRGPNQGASSLNVATATDADEDIALALLFASARWQNLSYAEEAEKIIHDIWDHSVVAINNKYYLTSGHDTTQTDTKLINPSYLSPATYRIFATIDPTHPWKQLATDSYDLLNQLSTTDSLDAQLIPNWVAINPEGTVTPVIPDAIPNAQEYGYDAFRVYWRIALDVVWFDSEEGKKFLKKIRPFFKSEWTENGRIAAVYSLEGAPRVTYEDISTYAGALSVLFVTDPEDSIDLYTTKLWPRYNNGFWGDRNNYYNQNWAWFATALYANNLPNLWGDDKGGHTARR